ncbi:hypothetical protein PHLGIDRAFT_125787, partial [Phlebiopsis gigantea 11061_1 CR5-6]
AAGGRRAPLACGRGRRRGDARVCGGGRAAAEDAEAGRGRGERLRELAVACAREAHGRAQSRVGGRRVEALLWAEEEWLVFVRNGVQRGEGEGACRWSRTTTDAGQHTERIGRRVKKEGPRCLSSTQLT